MKFSITLCMMAGLFPLALAGVFGDRDPAKSELANDLMEMVVRDLKEIDEKMLRDVKNIFDETIADAEPMMPGEPILPEEPTMPEAEEFVYGAPMMPDAEISYDGDMTYDEDMTYDTNMTFDGNMTYGEDNIYEEGMEEHEEGGWMYDDCQTEVMKDLDEKCLGICQISDMEFLLSLPEEIQEPFIDCIKSCVWEIVNNAMHAYYDHHYTK